MLRIVRKHGESIIVRTAEGDVVIKVWTEAQNKPNILLGIDGPVSIRVDRLET